MSGEQYYLSRMDPVRRDAYHAILTCLRELAPAARIPKMPMDDLSTLFFQLRLDHPEIFYAVGFSCRSSVGAAFWNRKNPGPDIFKDADTALLQVKKHGRSNCEIYGAEAE